MCQKKISFDELVEKVGFGMAVVICESSLPDEFWSGLNFDQWLDIGNATILNSALEVKSVYNFERLAKTFDQKYALLDFIVPYTKAWNDVVSDMEELAKTHEQWMKVYLRAESGSEAKKNAFAEIGQSAEPGKSVKTFNDWFKIYDHSKDGSEEKKKAFAEMEKTAKVSSDWLGIIVYFDSEDEIDGIILPKASELAVTIDDWVNIYHRALPGSKTQEKALSKIKEFVEV